MVYWSTPINSAFYDVIRQTNRTMTRPHKTFTVQNGPHPPTFMPLFSARLTHPYFNSESNPKPKSFPSFLSFFFSFSLKIFLFLSFFSHLKSLPLLYCGPTKVDLWLCFCVVILLSYRFICLLISLWIYLIVPFINERKRELSKMFIFY